MMKIPLRCSFTFPLSDIIDLISISFSFQVHFEFLGYFQAINEFGKVNIVSSSYFRKKKPSWKSSFLAKKPIARIYSNPQVV